MGFAFSLSVYVLRCCQNKSPNSDTYRPMPVIKNAIYWPIGLGDISVDHSNSNLGYEFSHLIFSPLFSLHYIVKEIYYLFGLICLQEHLTLQSYSLMGCWVVNRIVLLITFF